MKLRRLCNIVLILLLTANCQQLTAKNDSIYMGTQVKFDIASPIVVPALNNWKMQQYEVAVNVRLAKRYYPTLELGYAGGQLMRSDTVAYQGQGGFFRVGCDINMLKKHPNSPHALLIGARIGTGMQSKRTDCWGEIDAGCQVEICEVNNTAFYMGWMGRLKVLFTRKGEDIPEYIPGFGTRDNIGWGLNYYLGWRF